MNILRRTSLFTLLLLIANGGLFVVQVASGLDPLHPSPAELVLWGANIATLSLEGQSWRLLTSMFLHVGLVHLAFNMYMLLSWGPFVERYFGKLNFIALYVVAGLSGSLLSAWWALRPPENVVVSAGASGALMGIAGACLAVRLLHHHGRQIPPLLGPNMQTIALIIGINIAYGFMQPGIDNACHIGGLLGGLIVGALFALMARVRQPVLRHGLPALLLVLTFGWLSVDLMPKSPGPAPNAVSAALSLSGQ